MMKRLRLGDYITQIRGVSYKPADVCDKNAERAVPLLRANNIQDSGLNYEDLVYVDESRVSHEQYVQPGDIVICTSSGSKNLVGKAALVQNNTKCAFGAFCKVVRSAHINKQYLGQFFRSPYYRQTISEVSAGANINNIRNEHIANLMIPLPSTDRQAEIAEELGLIDSIIHDLYTQLALADQLVKSRFIEMFGDPATNPFKHPVRLLSDVAEYYNGLTYKPEDVSETGTVVLRSSNIQNSALDFADTVRVVCPVKQRMYVQDKDILMCSRNGSAKLVGKVALIHNLPEKMSFGAFMMIIRSQYSPYLFTYFQMDAFREQIRTGATTTINQITGRMLDGITLPVPPMEEIAVFADFVAQTDKSKFSLKNGGKEADFAVKCIWESLCRGTLT